MRSDTDVTDDKTQVDGFTEIFSGLLRRYKLTLQEPIPSLLHFQEEKLRAATLEDFLIEFFVRPDLTRRELWTKLARSFGNSDPNVCNMCGAQIDFDSPDILGSHIQRHVNQISSMLSLTVRITNGEFG